MQKPDFNEIIETKYCSAIIYKAIDKTLADDESKVDSKSLNTTQQKDRKYTTFFKDKKKKKKCQWVD